MVPINHSKRLGLRREVRAEGDMQDRARSLDEPLAQDPPAAHDARVLPALHLAPRRPVTALRWYGRGSDPVLLERGRGRFTIGASACDVVVPAALAAAVSAQHALLVRVHSGLRIDDRGSKNGTFRSLGSARLPSFQLEAGDRFWLADVPVLAVDDALEALRPQLAARLGLDRHDAVDAALVNIADGRPLALVGPAGLDAAALARAIHEAGAQRDNAFVTVTAAAPPLDEVRGGTIFVDLDRLRSLTAPQLRPWFDPANGVRVIVAGATERRLRACLDTYRDQLHAIALVPLAQRPGDVTRLLELHWRDRLDSPHRVEELGPGVAGLADYRWPRNLDELGEHAPRLLAYLERGSLRGAALALGIAHQTLDSHFARIAFAPSARRGEDGPRLVVVPSKPGRAREASLLGWLVGWAYSNRSAVNRCGAASSTANPMPAGPLAQ